MHIFGVSPKISDQKHDKIIVLLVKYARVHGTGSHLLPYFGFLKIKKIKVLAIIFSSIICIRASLTLFLQKISRFL